jgi:hypothetical protein
LVKKIARMPCGGGACNGSNSRPQNPVKITHIEIQGTGGAATKSGAKKSSGTKTSAAPKK